MAVGIFNTKNLFVFFTSSIENNIRNLEKKKKYYTHIDTRKRRGGSHERSIHILDYFKEIKKKKKTSDEPK